MIEFYFNYENVWLIEENDIGSVLINEKAFDIGIIIVEWWLDCRMNKAKSIRFLVKEFENFTWEQSLCIWKAAMNEDDECTIVVHLELPDEYLRFT